MKFIKDINKYCYLSFNLITEKELFIKLNNGIEYYNYNFKYWYKDGTLINSNIFKEIK
jgi:hypothetical protein